MRKTTVAQLQEILAKADGRDEVMIYADLVGNWVEMSPYSEKRAAVCGYFSAASVWVEKGMAVIETGAEAAL